MLRDDTWFEWLVDDTAERLLRYALRRTSPADAEDVVADAFLVAWRRRHDVPEPPEHLLWLFGVARRQLANARRGDRRRERLRLALARERPPSGTSQEDPRVDAVRQAMNELSETDAEVLRLVTWEGLSHAEAAVVLETTENAVALRASRARARLAELLDRSAATRT